MTAVAEKATETYSSWVRSRQCGHKVQYLSPMLARNMRTLLSWLDPCQLELDIYKCPWSKQHPHWHLGHPTKETSDSE